MSRIQHVLDKAEREGALRRTKLVDDHIGHDVLVDRLPPPRDSDLLVETPDSVVVATTTLEAHMVVGRTPASAVAEQYRALRTRILHGERGAATQVLLVTSPGRNEGRSLTVANLALAMAQSRQRRVCVLDADLRAPRQHQLFGISDRPGLSDVLLMRAPLESALVSLTEHEVSVLPAGPTPQHPAELLGTTAMRRVLQTLRSRFDHVIVDAPAAAPLADIGILAPLVDRIVLVVRAGTTSKPAIHEAIAAIEPTKLLGFVLNDRV
jgi:capsular exopolysaccharide synthesis family protein